MGETPVRFARRQTLKSQRGRTFSVNGSKVEQVVPQSGGGVSRSLGKHFPARNVGIRRELKSPTGNDQRTRRSFPDLFLWNGMDWNADHPRQE
jgi:hypothetical protein